MTEKKEILENDAEYDAEATLMNFAVLQSVADFQPDVDAIYRLTRTTPFMFQRPKPYISAPSVRRGRKK